MFACSVRATSRATACGSYNRNAFPPQAESRRRKATAAAQRAKPPLRLPINVLKESVQKKANATINCDANEFSQHGSASNRRLTLSGRRAFFEIVAATRRSSSAAVASRRRLAALRAGIGSDVLSNAILRVSQRRRYNNQNASRANRKIIVANLNRLRSVGPGR